MLRKLYSIFLHRNKETCRQIHQGNQTLQKHWLDAEFEKCKSFLPLPPEAEFGISIAEIKGLREELDGIHKKLSTSEERTLCKSCPLGNELYQP